MSLTGRWGRIIFAGATVSLLALLGWTGWRVVAGITLKKATEEFRTSVGSLDLMKLAPAPVPDHRNAAFWLLKGIEASVKRERGDMKDLGAFIGMDLAELGGARGERAEEILERHREVLEHLHRMEGLTSSSFDLDYSQGAAIEIPNLLSALLCGRLLLVEARLALARGEPQRAWSSLAALKGQVDAVYGEPVLVFALVGAALEQFLFMGLRDIAQGDGFAAAKWIQLVAESRSRNYTDLFGGAIQGDAAASRWMVTSGARHIPEMLGGGRLLLPGSVEGLVRTPEAWQALAEALHYYRSSAEAFPESSYAELRASGQLRKSQERNWIPNLERLAGRLKANQGIRLMAQRALELKAQQQADRLLAEGSSWVDPFTGRAVSVHRGEDGSTTFSIPRIEDVWKSVFPTTRRDGLRLFQWTVPAAVVGGAQPPKQRARGSAEGM